MLSDGHGPVDQYNDDELCAGRTGLRYLKENENEEPILGKLISILPLY